ncbi:MAG: hypothetical protein LC104_16115 [Bacteroidales bacterium]|nr:hypothetical protein [Bacteroidales bacterium]
MLTVAAFLLCGCGEEPRPLCQPVSGVIQVNGKPTKDLLISYHPQTATPRNAIAATGRSDEEGRYTLSSFLPNDGAPPGEYTITVVWPTSFQQIGGQDFPVGDRLGGVYANKANATWKATIREGESQLPLIEISKAKN